MQRAVSVRAKCRPVPAPPHSSTTLRAAGGSVPSTKGRRIARATPSTKASCPRTVFFTSSASPSKLPRCSGFASAVPLASRPSSSISRSILRLSSSADFVAASCPFRAAFCCLSNSSSFFCRASRAAFQSGSGLSCIFSGFSGLGWAACGVLCENLSLPPGPNTPFIKLSQSSVYAIAASVCVFSQYSVLPVVLQGKA